MIVTLAGHVDHGKTSLVRALTGVDTDRLAEEKKRGLTIDLGFAYLTEHNLGFVDVPGHHRFIHNMVAGVAAHQFALLVVAADDGPMPQTVEHLQILTLLGLTRGAIALTKIDAVDDELKALAEEQVRELVEGTFLEAAPIIQCSSLERVGIDELLATLQQAQTTLARAPNDRRFRMPVDRSFNVRGAGTVVTGTTHSGSVAVESPITIYSAQRPHGIPARVRGIHADNVEAQAATVGQRTALNLGNVSVADVQRGAWVATPDQLLSTQIAMQLDVLRDFPRRVRHWTPVHVYHGTTHTQARLALLDGNHVAPGETAWAELITEEPLLARANDRVLIRDQSLDTTLGGGRVVDIFCHELRRRSERRLARLQALNQEDDSSSMQSLLELGPVDLTEISMLLGTAEPVKVDDAVIVEGRAVTTSQWSQWCDDAVKSVEAFQQANPHETGAKLSDLDAAIPSRFRAAVLRALVDDKRLLDTAGNYHLPQHAATLSPQQQGLLDMVLPHIDRAQPASVGDLSKRLNKPMNALSRGLSDLAKLGVLNKVSDNRFYVPEQLDELATEVRTLCSQSPLTVKAFRDATGMGRNVAIEVLEHFDARGYTKRQGDARIVIGDWRA